MSDCKAMELLSSCLWWGCQGYTPRITYLVALLPLPLLSLIYYQKREGFDGDVGL
jgi:hypothetical protein